MREHDYPDFDQQYLARRVQCDFGPLRVPVPAVARLRLSQPDARHSDAVYFEFPDGDVRLSVLAAPREGRLWPQRAEEIAADRAGAGEQVRAFSGEWGLELRITDATTTNWVIGLDGPRWMLLGRATSHRGAATDLLDTMRAMIRGSVVVRGDEPLPVRTPLPLHEPGRVTVADKVEQRANPYAGALSVRIPLARGPITDDRVRA
jgi:hypothetical protein